MLKKLLMVVATGALASTVFAGDAARAEAKRVVDLKGGATLYIFTDGKMAMEDKFGRAARMQKDTVMETQDGKKIIMHGDEVARLETLLRQGHEGN